MTKLGKKAQKEYEKRTVERSEHEIQQRDAVRATLNSIEQANTAGILAPHMEPGFVRKYLSKIRNHMNHPFSTEELQKIVRVEDLYTELCSRVPTNQFIIDFLTVNPPSHQMAQQYAKLLQDRLTFIERFNPEKI